MWAILADNPPKPILAWLMLSLLALLIGGFLVAWLLGRLLGPKAHWGKPLTGDRGRKSDKPDVDAWSESAKRMRLERDEDEPTS